MIGHTPIYPIYPAKWLVNGMVDDGIYMDVPHAVRSQKASDERRSTEFEYLLFCRL